VLLLVVGLVFLGWWGGAHEPPVVEPVDVFECCQFEVVESVEWSRVVDEFGLVETDDRFG